MTIVIRIWFVVVIIVCIVTNCASSTECFTTDIHPIQLTTVDNLNISRAMNDDAEIIITPEVFWSGFEDFLLLSTLSLEEDFQIYCSALNVKNVPIDTKPAVASIGIYNPDYQLVSVSTICFRKYHDNKYLNNMFRFNECDYWEAYSGDASHDIHIQGLPVNAINSFTNDEIRAIILILYFNEEELFNQRLNTSIQNTNHAYKELLLNDFPQHFDEVTYSGAFAIVSKFINFDHIEFGSAAMYFAYNAMDVDSQSINAVVTTRSALVSNIGLFPSYYPEINNEFPDCYTVWLYCGKSPIVQNLEIISFQGCIK
jgi:hypothetical protein